MNEIFDDNSALEQKKTKRVGFLIAYITIQYKLQTRIGKCGGLMASALDSGLN